MGQTDEGRALQEQETVNVDALLGLWTAKRPVCRGPYVKGILRGYQSDQVGRGW